MMGLLSTGPIPSSLYRKILVFHDTAVQCTSKDNIEPNQSYKYFVIINISDIFGTNKQIQHCQKIFDSAPVEKGKCISCSWVISRKKFAKKHNGFV